MTGAVIFRLPPELLFTILGFEILSDDEAVLIARTSKKWRAVFASWTRHEKRCFNLSGFTFFKSLPLIVWARENGYDMQFTARSFAVAASYGDLQVLKWLKNVEKCPWDKAVTLWGAGNVETVEWLDREGAPWDDKACTLAAEYGRLDVLKWIKSHGKTLWDQYTLSYAARRGRLEVVKWLITEGGCPWDPVACAHAAGHGQLEVLQWMRANGSPWDERVCAYAAVWGELDIIKWAKSQGCPWDSWACTYAAYHDYLGVLKWLRDNGCPWDEMTWQFATRGGHVEVIKWLEDNGCPGS